MDAFEKSLKDYHDIVDIGFSWDNPLQIIHHIKLELDEVKAELSSHNQEALQEELGDVLHACMELVDFCGFDTKEIFTLANKKFETRFNALKAVIKEEVVGDFKNLSREEKLVYWNKAKQRQIIASNLLAEKL